MKNPHLSIAPLFLACLAVANLARADFVIDIPTVQTSFEAGFLSELTTTNGPFVEQLAPAPGVTGAKIWGSAVSQAYASGVEAQGLALSLRAFGRGTGTVTDPDFIVSAIFELGFISDVSTPLSSMIMSVSLELTDGETTYFPEFQSTEGIQQPGIPFYDREFHIDLTDYVGMGFKGFDSRILVFATNFNPGDTLSLNIPQFSFDLGAAPQVAVPEPGSACLALLAMPGLWLLARRWRR